jgi:hypothetical protein
MDDPLRDPRKRNACFERLEEDDIRVFKRVRILCPSHLDISGERRRHRRVAAPTWSSEAIPGYSDAHRKQLAPPGRCRSCNRAETSHWRRGPEGARTLCNACGLHYAKLTRKNKPIQESYVPSKHEWEAWDWQKEPVVFQTSTFKNSHYHPAHYNNQNFQPQEWDAEIDDQLLLRPV